MPALAAEAAGPSRCLQLSDIESRLDSTVAHQYTPIHLCQDDACFVTVMERAAANHTPSPFRACSDDEQCLCFQGKTLLVSDFRALEKKAAAAALPRDQAAVACILRPEDGLLSANDPDGAKAGIALRSMVEKGFRCMKDALPPGRNDSMDACGQSLTYDGLKFRIDAELDRAPGSGVLTYKETFYWGSTNFKKQSSSREFFATLDTAGRLSGAIGWKEAGQCLMAQHASCSEMDQDRGYWYCKNNEAVDPDGLGMKLHDEASAVNSVSISIEQEQSRQSAAASQAATQNAAQSQSVRSLQGAASSVGAAQSAGAQASALGKEFDNSPSGKAALSADQGQASPPSAGQGSVGPGQLADDSAQRADKAYSQAPAVPPPPAPANGGGLSLAEKLGLGALGFSALGVGAFALSSGSSSAKKNPPDDGQ